MLIKEIIRKAEYNNQSLNSEHITQGRLFIRTEILLQILSK